MESIGDQVNAFLYGYLTPYLVYMQRKNADGSFLVKCVVMR